MIDFLTSLQSLFNITVVTEYAACLAAYLFLRKRATTWRWFIPFFLLAVFIETLGWYLARHLHYKNNSWIFNLLLVATKIFYLWMLSTTEIMRPSKKRINFVIIVFGLFATWNMFFYEGFWDYNFRTETVGDILIAILACYFFWEALKEEKYRNLLEYEYFWLANGLLFYSMGSAILYIYINDLIVFYQQTRVNVYGYINYSLNVLLQGSLIIAFICRHKKAKLSQVSSSV